MAVISPHRVVQESGKGVEALRAARVDIFHTVAGSQSPVFAIGPFEVDVDVRRIVCTSGLVPADNASNILKVYNGLVATNHVIATWDWHTVVPVVGVPVVLTLSGFQRVLAGTPILVAATLAGSDAAAGACLSVTVSYEIPINDPTAMQTTYGAYNQGF